ncbi:MAG: ABC transporter ATP-binding protein [Candidatus Methylomirabilota bacterium]
MAPGSGPPPAPGATALRLVGLHKAFDGQPVLRGVDLAIRAGESLTIMGGSGTGKSVLLRCMIGLLKPDAGQVFVEDQDIAPLSEAALLLVRRGIGMVFQGSALFDSMSVGENVAFALREHTDLSEARIAERVGTVLEWLGLSGTEAMDPAALSGGMRKRVAMARAIALPPRILLYDEPTTGLDPATVEKITDLILDLKRRLGITSVVVTHDMQSAAKVSDRLAMLHDGRIAAVGTPEEIRSSHDSLIREFMEGRLAQ